MNESSESHLQQAITAIAQSDPITKLLQEVRLGRKRPDDRGLRAVTESWLTTYCRVLETSPLLDRGAWLRLDPSPRLQILMEAGILTDGHPLAAKLQLTFQRKLADLGTSESSQG
jgi:hypothetical protein